MKPIVKRALYMAIIIGMLSSAKLISKEFSQSYTKCIAYMARNINSRS